MPASRSLYLDVGRGDPVPGDPGGVRIGSESCSRLLPSAGQIRRLSQERDPAGLSLVTPIAGPDEVQEVLRTIEAAAGQGWGEVVVNDWGVLKEAGRAAGAGVTAGRLLMRLRRGPGTFDPLEELDPATRRYFAWGPLYDSPFLAFLEARGVGRIEVDPPRHWLPMPEMGRFRLSFHQDTRLISIAATCPWLYDEEAGKWVSTAGCGCPCMGRGDIRMTTSALEEPLFLRGRAILERVRLDLDEMELPGAVDRVICDPAVSRLP